MKPQKPAVPTAVVVEPPTVKQQIEALELGAPELAHAVQQAMQHARSGRVVAIHDLLRDAQDRKRIEGEATKLVELGRTGGTEQRRAVCETLRLGAGATGELFLVHRMSRMTRGDARAYMTDYLAAGCAPESVALWLRLAGQVLREAGAKDPDTAGVVADAASDAVGWLKDLVEDGVDAVVESIEAVLDALAEAGMTIAQAIAKVVHWTVEELTDLFTALLQTVGALAQIVTGALKLAYRYASRVVQALIAAGAAVVDIVGEALTATYWGFRRVIFGLVEALGSAAEILAAVFAHAADALDDLWRIAVQAIRYAMKRLELVTDWLRDAFEWAVEKGTAAMEALVRAWEAAGEALRDLYQIAAQLAEDVWEVIGEVCVRIGNSLSYVWDFVTTDLLPGVFHFVRGVLRAGLAVAEVIAWGLAASFEVLTEVVRASLEMGATIGRLIADTILHPGDALQNVMRAMREIGTTLSDLYQAAIVETAEEFLDAVTRALVQIGEGVRDMLDAVKQVAAGAVGTVIGILMTMLASYRELTPEEIEDGRTVFGNAIDYSRVRISVEDPMNDLIFGIQDFANNNEDSRAFVTNTLINFDVDDGLTRHTLVHELTHVWQFRHVGPEYLLQAVDAQVFGAGYGYGYEEGVASVTIPIDRAGNTASFDAGAVAGFRGGAALEAANGNLEAFNREQQGQIAMHYFVRKHLLGEGAEIRDGGGNVLETVDIEPWQDYVDVLQAA